MFPKSLKAAVGILTVAGLIGLGAAGVPGQEPATPAKADPAPKQAEAKVAAIKALQERLQGTWKCAALQAGGVKSERDLTCTIKGNTWETRLDGRAYQSGTLKVVDPDASPRHIDWVITSDAVEKDNEGKTFHGIFMLDGDSLCCVNSDAAVSPRPQVFFTEPNDGCYAAMYRRVDPTRDR